MVRVKHRYLLGEIHWLDQQLPTAAFTQAKFLEHIKNALLINYGDYLWGKLVVGGFLTLKHFNPLTGRFILRVAREDAREMWLTLCTIGLMDGSRCKVEVKHLGGTIRSTSASLLANEREK